MLQIIERIVKIFTLAASVAVLLLFMTVISFAAENDTAPLITGNSPVRNFNAANPNPMQNNVSNDSETAVSQANPGSAIAPSENSELYKLVGIDASKPIEIVLLLTIIAVAPSILLMTTCFTRIIIVFGFLRNAMQTQTTPPNQIMTGLALFLTIFIMWPTFTQINDVAYRPYTRGEITASQAIAKAGEPMKDFMLRQTSKKNMTFFLDLAHKTIYENRPAASETANTGGVQAVQTANTGNAQTVQTANTGNAQTVQTANTGNAQTVQTANTGGVQAEQITTAPQDNSAPTQANTGTSAQTPAETRTPVNLNADGITLENYRDQLGMEIVIPAFMISELSRAFQMGFMIFIPFLIIDIVVSSVLMSMGMMMLPPAMISLPFKIMMFVLVDGWKMLVGSVITSFN